MKPIKKIPVSIAPHLGVDKSTIIRWNQGSRRFDVERAIEIVEVMKRELQVEVDITEIMPSLKKAAPYICLAIAKKNRKKPCYGHNS